MPMLPSATVGRPGIDGGSAGFSTKLEDRRSSSMAITPNAVASSRGTSRQPTVTPSPLLDVVGDHERVVHLVDVIAGQHEDEVGRDPALDDVEVLVDRVGGAHVPVVVEALLGRQQVDELVELAAHEAPAALQMAQQRVRLVLGGDADAADSRVEAVREREVDDPELAAEVDRRLRAPIGELHQPRSASAREHQRSAASAELERFLTRNLVHACHLALPDRRRASASAVARSARRVFGPSDATGEASIEQAAPCVALRFGGSEAIAAGG